MQVFGPSMREAIDYVCKCAYPLLLLTEWMPVGYAIVERVRGGVGDGFHVWSHDTGRTLNAQLWQHVCARLSSYGVKSLIAYIVHDRAAVIRLAEKRGWQVGDEYERGYTITYKLEQ